MANQDAPKAGEPTTRIVPAGNGYWQVEEWLSNQFWGGWHAYGAPTSDKDFAERMARALK